MDFLKTKRQVHPYLYSGARATYAGYKLQLSMVTVTYYTSLYTRTHHITKASVWSDFKENHVSCEVKTSLFSAISPIPLPTVTISWRGYL